VVEQLEQPLVAKWWFWRRAVKDSYASGWRWNTPSTSPAQGNAGGVGQPCSSFNGGGGGGASAAGTNGTLVLQLVELAALEQPQAITGSSVTYAGGGGGGAVN
jgi:hypothetical protein